jgi:hypothetical protein
VACACWLYRKWLSTAVGLIQALGPKRDMIRPCRKWKTLCDETEQSQQRLLRCMREEIAKRANLEV